MDSNHVSSNPMSVCERIFKAVSISPVRTKRPISYRPPDAMPAPNTSNPFKALERLTTPENKKAAEVIPIEISRSISIEVDDAGFQHKSIQNHCQEAKAVLKVKPAIKQNTGQSYDKVATTAGIEVASPKPKVGTVQQKKTVVGSVQDQVDKHVLMKEPKQLQVPKTVKDQRLVDHTYGEGMKSALNNNANDKFSDYINRAKLKIRATSDVGKHTPRVDSMNEKASSFIDRAKIKLRSTSSIGDGKSVSFK